jgi:hypothetical protein
MASLSDVAEAYGVGVVSKRGRLSPKLARYADEVGEQAGKSLARELEGRALPVGLKLGAGIGTGTALGAAGGTYVANRVQGNKRLKALKARERA